MALEFICAESVEPNKKIVVPRQAGCYRLKSGRIKFFRESFNGEKRIPELTAYVSFAVERNRYNIEYGPPSFYDREGNILNTENNS